MVHPPLHVAPAGSLGMAIDRISRRDAAGAPQGGAGRTRIAGDFAALLTEEAAQPDAPAAAAATPPLADRSAAGLADPGTGAVRDRAARRRGETLLAALGGVQVALLTDDQARANAALTALVAAADGAGGADDAALQGLLDEIQLRATVELARREQDPDVATV